MIIEGHFAGTRAKHYTNRYIEDLQDIYRTAYPFVRLSIDEPLQLRTDNEIYDRKFADLEARLDRQRILEAKLTVLEDEICQMREFRKRLEHHEPV